jgi:hypothetical protein
MDHILSTIMAGSGEVLGQVIGFGIVALLFVAGVLPIYFIMKKVSGSKTTFAEDLHEYFTARPWSQPRPETLGVLSTLDSVESIVLRVYKYALILGLVLGSVFIVWFFISTQNAAERSFLRLYFGAAYLFLVFWVVGSFVMIKRRQARISGDQTGIQRINFQIQQATETIMLNETSLQAARMWVAAGETIESVCGYINPEYKQWDAVKRQAFEMAVKGAVAARMPQETAAAAGRSPAGRTQIASPVPELIRASVEPAPAPGVRAAPSKDAHPAASALTPQQIVIVVMVFVFAVGTFSVIFLMLKGLPQLPF